MDLCSVRCSLLFRSFRAISSHLGSTPSLSLSLRKEEKCCRARSWIYGPVRGLEDIEWRVTWKGFRVQERLERPWEANVGGLGAEIERPQFGHEPEIVRHYRRRFTGAMVTDSALTINSWYMVESYWSWSQMVRFPAVSSHFAILFKFEFNKTYHYVKRNI